MFPAIDDAGPGNRLAENVMHFARLLRGAGLRLGPDRVVDCVQADRKSTRLNSSHPSKSRMPSSA